MQSPQLSPCAPARTGSWGWSCITSRQSLNIFDGATGQQVSQKVDNRVERLMNALMDDARAKVDAIGVEKTKGEHTCYRWWAALE